MKTNHLELAVKINGKKGRFILDTGASNSCVGLELAEYFKLKVKESDVKVAGAGAVGMETQVSKKNYLKIGKWQNKTTHLVLFNLFHVNMALQQQDEKNVQGIIGADILELGKAFIDYDKKILYLKKFKKKKQILSQTIPF